ncbi:branched-chain amino acid transaminase [SAR202 cluster bacterium AD-804-J14_MRT_500m]|nr:branched-chain amino acid transaminase [SAR202 cluster bacterium AD-804-J14_MRT_500m]
MTQARIGKETTLNPKDTPKYLWWSGKIVEWDKATVHISRIGWTSVSAVFEGIRAYWNDELNELFVFELEPHLKRLYQSMKIMRMTAPCSKQELGQGIIELLRSNEYRCDSYVQPLAYFSEDIPGYLGVLEAPAEVVITTRKSPSSLGESKSANCNISSWTRISDNSMPPRAKAITNYQNSRYVSTESQLNGYDFGIILNQNGKVSEGGYACIFIIRDGVAITPPVTAGILESVTREVMKKILQDDLGVPVLEREIDRTELYVADEAFLCGTAVELIPIASVDRYTVGNAVPGPISSKLKDLFHKAVRGEESRRTTWTTPIYYGR